MNDKEWLEFSKRYDKFKKNNLPTPFWDEERQTFEYVWFSQGNVQTASNLQHPIERLTFSELYYPYTARTAVTGVDARGHSHAHSFEEVIKDLYSFPESFKISRREEKYYSYQELKMLRRIQKYLLFIGLKDADCTKKRPVSRYRNKNIDKYYDCAIFKINAKEIKRIKEGKLDFLPWKYGHYFEPKKYEDGEFCALLVDDKDNFLYFVMFTESKLLRYKDIKKILPIPRLNDNSKVVAYYFKIIEKY